MQSWLILVLCIFIASVGLTAVMRLCSLRYGILARPNDRSSHKNPTPVAGGVGIVVSLLGGLFYLLEWDKLPADFFWVFCAGGLVIAGLGLFDDIHPVKARWRLLAHCLTIGYCMLMSGGLDGLDIFGVYWAFGWFENLLLGFLLVWLINLYNFMDGIDGIAASEAVSVAVGVGLIAYIQGDQLLLLLAMLVLSSTAGFLFWNWPPARIFMGDVGSGFLGFVMAMLLLLSAQREIVHIWTWLLLLGVFIVDATLTLLIRMKSGEKWYLAHCRHGYQIAARRWGHKTVTIGVIMINIGWLLPLAVVSIYFPGQELYLLLLGWLPLVWSVLLMHKTITRIPSQQ